MLHKKINSQAPDLMLHPRAGALQSLPHKQRLAIGL